MSELAAPTIDEKSASTMSLPPIILGFSPWWSPSWFGAAHGTPRPKRIKKTRRPTLCPQNQGRRPSGGPLRRSSLRLGIGAGQPHPTEASPPPRKRLTKELQRVLRAKHPPVRRAHTVWRRGF